LKVDRGTLRLVVADDGIGFDPAHLPAPDGGQHFGLLIMSELEAVGYVAIEKEFLGKKPNPKRWGFVYDKVNFLVLDER